MDATLYDQIQRDEAAADEPEVMLNTAIEAHALRTHTSLPGIIVSYDSAKQTAKVQPAIQTIFRETGPVAIEPLVDVPVHFPRGGGFVLTFPVASGDECLLVFSERAIDFWWQNGGVQLPVEYRLHDLSDAFAYVGFSSLPNIPVGMSTTAVELRAVDGTSKVALAQDGSVTVISKAGANVNVAAGASINETSSGSGTINLNAPPGATQQTNGVVLAMDPCPILGSLHGSFGCGAARVLAGKT